MRVVLATRNDGKIAELRRILAAYDIELVGLDAVPGVGEIAETAATFAENAMIKAREVSRLSGLVAIADDSGLTVDALNGMPGVLSARWSGRHGDDAANLQLVLAQLADVPDERRGAAFVCAAAASAPDGREVVVEEQVTGRLLREPRGTNGFGYDPIFVPDGATMTTAEMAPERKDEISHRGKAFRALAPLLADLL
ncbi:MAG TPA: RdgB/HAM1 family non-canonical purine NTP pyrophosphatase [Mycobacteriales bacterium]|nr:RdgB/HAM1 family non-canonical purine NTP pyrophosphatase [Mycobacteriales bacterium]